MSIEPQPASPGATVEFCYRHPTEETRVHCTRCGRPICPACMIPAPVGHQCPTCVDEARKAFRQGPVDTARRLAGSSVTKLLLAAIVAVYVVEIVLSLQGGGVLLQPSQRTLFQMGGLAPPEVAAGQYWRLFTAMFLHASVFHILLNGWALWIFGQFVEGSFGRVRLLVIYFVSGFLASVASYAFGSILNLGVGASGAIVGLLGAFIAYNLRRRHLSLAQNNLRLAMMIILMNVVFGLAVRNVDNWAHGGGLVAGFLVGWAIEGFGPPRTRMLVTIISVAALVALGVVGVAWRTSQITG